MMQEHTSGTPLQKIAEGALLLLTFLVPLKFGSLSGLPEAASYFPPDWLDYLFITWPASAFGIFSGAVLLLAALAFPENLTAYRNPEWRVAALWCIGIPLLALFGLVNCSGYDFAPIILNNFLGIGCYAAAVMLVISGDAGRHRRFGNVLTAAMLLTVWFGVEQYFWGFERARQFLLDQQAQGVAVDEILMLRTFDTRVYGTFSGCNTLAAYLLVTLPLAAVVLRRWADRVEPAAVTKYLFWALGIGSGILVLMLTKSRAAYFAMLLTAGVLALLYPMKRRWKILLILSAAGIVAAGAFYIRYHGRGFDSMISRMDYLRSSWLLWLEHPFFGCGWGEFFYGHMRLKTISHIEAAHDPHNILVTMLQAGPLLMLLTAAVLAEPFLRLWKRLRNDCQNSHIPWIPLAGLCALSGYYFHALMDIDLAVPGCMAALFGVQIWFLSMPGESTEEMPEDTKRVSRWAMVILAIWSIGCCAASWTMLRGEKALDELSAACGAGMLPGDGKRMTSPGQMEQCAANFGKWRPWSSYQYSLPGDYYLKMGDVSLAQQRYDAALKLAPRRPAIYWRKATIARMMGDETAAKMWREKTLSLFPRNPEYQKMPPIPSVLPKKPSGFGFSGKSFNNSGK